MNTVRILIAEDHPVVGESLQQFVSLAPHASVCGLARTIAEVSTLLEQAAPDILLLDLHLGREEAWRHCATFKAIRPGLRIVGISASRLPLEMGVEIDAFIEKTHLMDQLFETLQSISTVRPDEAEWPNESPSPIAYPIDESRALQESIVSCLALKEALSRGDDCTLIEQSHRLKMGLICCSSQAVRIRARSYIPPSVPKTCSKQPAFLSVSRVNWNA